MLHSYGVRMKCKFAVSLQFFREIAKPMSFSNDDDRILHFLDLAFIKANLYQTYAKLTPYSYPVRLKHMNTTITSILVPNSVSYEKHRVCSKRLRRRRKKIFSNVHTKSIVVHAIQYHNEAMSL